MDKRTKRFFGLGVSLALLIALAFLAYRYVQEGGLSAFTAVMVLGSTGLAIVGSYWMYHSFFEREKQMVFAPGEEVILQRKYPDKSVIIPKMIGREGPFDGSPIEVNLYLTNIGIAAEPPGSGEPVVYIPLNDIQEMKTVNRLLLRYIELRFVDFSGALIDVLIYVDKDTDTWAENIGRMIV